MNLHFLGTAGYHPNEDRHTACYMIPESGIVLDAGTGFFRVRELAQTAELHVFLSHCHLDHCIGLSFFIDIMHDTPVQRFHVYGEAPKLEQIRTHLFARELFPVTPDFRWIPLEPGQPLQVPGQARLTPFPLDHPGGSLGLRFDWADHSLAYVTDTSTGPEAGYLNHISPVDLLLHECHFPDGMEELAAASGHSCLTQVARTCRAADVGRAVIIHLNPLTVGNPPLDLESVANIFDRLSLGHDGLSLPLGPSITNRP